jgi:hypothetical protein
MWKDFGWPARVVVSLWQDYIHVQRKQDKNPGLSDFDLLKHKNSNSRKILLFVYQWQPTNKDM